MAALSAVLVLTFACAPPNPTRVGALVSPTPSPSPTPTAPLQAAGPGFHAGEVGIAFAPIALTASGGLAPYTWTVSAGALPPGLILGGDGTISGTPTGGGAYKFTVQVVDSGGSMATIDGGISIADRLTAHINPSCAQSCNVELGCADACGDFGSLTGGLPPIAFALAGGTLPAGTSLNGFSLKGTFKGMSGFLTFTVQATDGLGATTTISPTFWMYDHISLTGGTCQNRSSCKVTISFGGGTPGPLPTVAPTGWAGAPVCGSPTGGQAACPQPNFNATVQPGQVNIVLVYQAGYSNTTGTMTLAITDNSLCAPSTRCTATATLKVVG